MFRDGEHGFVQYGIARSYARLIYFAGRGIF